MLPLYAECQRCPSGLRALPGEHTSTVSALQSLEAQSRLLSQDLSFGKPPV